MTIFSVVNERGKGKTAFATNHARIYSIKKPHNKIYSNYHLNLPNTFYTPFMVLPFSELHDCLIICDDFYALDCQKGFTKVISNLSRKTDIDIIITVQYYTAIPPNIRNQSVLVEVNLNIENDILDIKFIKKVFNPFNPNEFKVYTKECYETNIIDKVKNLYDTKEVVKFSSERKVCKEILRISKTQEDILDNIELYADSLSKRNRYMKIMKELNPNMFLKNSF